MQNNIILKTIIITNKTRNWATDVTNRWRVIFINRIGWKRNLRGTCCFQIFFLHTVGKQSKPHTTHDKIIYKSFKYVCTRYSVRNLVLDDFLTSHPTLREFSHDIYTLYYSVDRPSWFGVRFSFVQKYLQTEHTLHCYRFVIITFQRDWKTQPNNTTRIRIK